MKAIKSIKQAIESDNVIVTKILQGRNEYRVDARTRFPQPDADNFFSKWASKAYVDRLCEENYGKQASELRCFEY